MRIITDYSYLFKNMVGKSNQKQVNDIQVSQLGSRSVQSKLRAAGIDTNSAQYKAAIKEMTSHPGSMGMLTNVQAIKNIMNTYDKHGDEIDPNTGLTGIFVTEKTASSKRKIISIPESSREDIFNLAKKEFLKSNGMSEGDGRQEIYTDLQRKTEKSKRLSASHTLSQYERAYKQAFIDAAKAVDPKWDYGRPIPAGALDGITRESIDNSLVKGYGAYGETLVRKSVNTTV